MKNCSYLWLCSNQSNSIFLKCYYKYLETYKTVFGCVTFQAFAKKFGMAPDDLDMHVIYDVSHNIAKFEEHIVDGKPKTLLVHRKVSF